MRPDAVPCLLGTAALATVDDIRGEQDIVAQPAHRDGAEHGRLAPVETTAFHDGDAGAHKAWRKKHGDRIHQTGLHECSVDPAATLDEEGLHLTAGEQPQHRAERDAAITIRRDESEAAAQQMADKQARRRPRATIESGGGAALAGAAATMSGDFLREASSSAAAGGVCSWLSRTTRKGSCVDWDFAPARRTIRRGLSLRTVPTPTSTASLSLRRR